MDVNKARHAENKTQPGVFLSAGSGCGHGSQLQYTIAGNLPRSFLGFIFIGWGLGRAEQQKTLPFTRGWEALNQKPFITITGWYFTFQPLETFDFCLQVLFALISPLRNCLKSCCLTPLKS